MRIPGLRPGETARRTVSSFGGIDRGDGADASSFTDMKNMTGAYYPCAAPRERRGILNFGGAEIFGITTQDVLIDGEIVRNAFIADCSGMLKAFYMKDGKFISRCLQFTETYFTQGEKQLVECGGYLYFFPDKKYINLMDTTVKGSLEAEKNIVCGVSDDHPELFYEAVLTPCDSQGQRVTGTGEYMLLSKKCYRAVSGAKGDYLSDAPYAADFEELDTVELSGFDSAELCGSFTVWKKLMPEGKLVLNGSLSAETVKSFGKVTVKRSVPDMDYVISSGNRLWGCRYGVDSYGKPLNEIYASAPGDPKNWHRFLGNASDSWTASVGQGGMFTGAVCFGGRPVFFKEDCIIRVYGDYPSEYSVSISEVRGVEKGSPESIAVVNDALYYKTYNGICVYDGGVPRTVDAPLGKRFRNAVAGSCGNRYFVSMEDGDGVRRLYVYDTVRRLWHMEDGAAVRHFSRCGSELFMLCKNGAESFVMSVGGTVNSDSGCSGELEAPVEWSCDSGDHGFECEGGKRVASLGVRMELPVGSRCEVLIEYDRSGTWEPLRYLTGWGRKRAQVRLRPRRCDTFRLRLRGRGECKIFSVTENLEICKGEVR